MIFSTIELVWIAAGLLFVLGQASVAAVVACIPDNLNSAVGYVAFVAKPLDILLKTNFGALLFAIGMTWVHFSTESKDEEWVNIAIPTVMTLGGLFSFIVMDNLIHRVLQARLRS